MRILDLKKIRMCISIYRGLYLMTEIARSLIIILMSEVYHKICVENKLKPKLSDFI